MADYRRSDLDLSSRIELTRRMLDPERPWGAVTDWAREHEVSRQFLYDLRDSGQQALAQALAAHPPGPHPQPILLETDPAWLQRSILACAMVTAASERQTQLLLELVGPRRCSLGYISQTLQQAGHVAARLNEQIQPAQTVLGEADEIFQGRRPCLTVVDGASLAILHLSVEAARDATTWGVTFLDLLAQGIEFADVARDGAKGLCAGLQEAAPTIPVRPDRFHQVRDAHQITARLERRAYRAIEAADKVRRAETQARGGPPRRGRKLKVTLTREQAQQREHDAIDCYDLWRWLWQQVWQLLEPLTLDDHLTVAGPARDTLEVALQLMQELPDRDVQRFAAGLQEQLDELLAPQVWLQQTLSAWQQALDPATQQLIIWAWRHREVLQVEIARDFPLPLQPWVQTFWETMTRYHRASSLAECVHAWLRPYLHAHRGIPDWLLPLLQLFWNHHPFQRGQRQGHSPLELAGVPDVPSLSELLEELVQAITRQPEPVDLPAAVDLPAVA